MRELAFGARLTLAGGRAGLLRTAITAAGVALGVAALLVAASLPGLYDARTARNDARVPIENPRGDLLVGDVQTDFREHIISGRLLEPIGPSEPLPPGIARMPEPGEVFVSPALRELLATPDGRRLLAPRIPGRVVGEIGREGLVGPSELGFYTGARGLKAGGPVLRVDRFGSDAPRAPFDPLLMLLAVIVLVALLLPVAVVVGAAVRTGGEDRDRRLAALRLVGADRGMARRIAAGEALVAAAFGLALGVLLFFAARGLIQRVSFQGFSVYGVDVRPSPLLALAVVAGVPAAAVAVSLAALRQVVAEPLGVVRRADAGRPRRLWWRLVLPLLGLAALVPAASQSQDEIDATPVAVGVIALLVGVAALLPWVVERVVARLGAGKVAWQLAVRRLQLDPGGAARAVSGITVAVAGAIALQMVFAGVQADFEAETGADPSRASLYVTLDQPRVNADELAASLAAAPGVRSAGAMTEYGAIGESILYVAPCATLRELAAVRDCAEGDAFVTRGAPVTDRWLVSGHVRTIDTRPDPVGFARPGTFATPSAVRTADVPPASIYAYVRTDPKRPDAAEQVRNAAAAVDPLLTVNQVERTVTDAQYATLRRAMLAGATIVIALIGLSLLLTALEQLRERRRLLAVLVAFGTRRSTLGWSLLWQSAVPVGLGLGIAVLTGIALGAVLLRMVGTGVYVSWIDVAGMTGVGAAVVLLVTAASLPVLWRTMRPEGLRTE